MIECDSCVRFAILFVPLIGLHEPCIQTHLHLLSTVSPYPKTGLDLSTVTGLCTQGTQQLSETLSTQQQINSKTWPR
jgi:hypothetical protein